MFIILNQFHHYIFQMDMKYLKSAHKNNGLVMNQISNINTPLADQTLRRYVQVGIGACPDSKRHRSRLRQDV